MAKILIVGAGDVGGRLARRLADAGHEVHALRRQARPQDGIQAIVADVTRPETLVLPAGVDVLVIALAPGESGEAAYRRVYLEGTRAVLAALPGPAPRQLLWVSSTSVYGEQDGERVDADTPARPVSATARVLLESEQLAAASGIPCTCVRFSGLYGPGRERLLQWVRSGRPVQAVPPSWSNRLHVEDAAGLLAHLCALALAGKALPPVVIGTDSCPVPQHEVLDWLAAQMGVAAVPRLPAGGSAGKRIDNAALAGLGYALHYPDFRSGYAAVLAATD